MKLKIMLGFLAAEITMWSTFYALNLLVPSTANPWYVVPVILNAACIMATPVVWTIINIVD